MPAQLKGVWVSRLRFLLRRGVLWPLAVLVERPEFGTARRVRLFGIKVYIDERDAGGDAEVESVAAKVRAALELLAKVDPRRLARMRADVPRVLVKLASSSSYSPFSARVVLALVVVQDYDAPVIAATLVHEATHARLERQGIRPWPDLLPRVERRCVLEQVAFVERVPGGMELAEFYRGRLDAVWWTPEQTYERLVRFFEEIGLPSWFIRAYRFVARPRTAR